MASLSPSLLICLILTSLSLFVVVLFAVCPTLSLLVTFSVFVFLFLLCRGSRVCAFMVPLHFFSISLFLFFFFALAGNPSLPYPFPFYFVFLLPRRVYSNSRPRVVYFVTVLGSELLLFIGG